MAGLKGFLYSFTRTNRGDAGAGVKDDAFQYPWMKPAYFYTGPGNGVMGQMLICEGNPSYYGLSLTNAPAQGPGNISGSVDHIALIPNFYNPGENTAYF